MVLAGNGDRFFLGGGNTYSIQALACNSDQYHVIRKPPQFKIKLGSEQIVRKNVLPFSKEKISQNISYFFQNDAKLEGNITSVIFHNRVFPILLLDLAELNELD